MCLCETWLKVNRLPSFINYSVFYTFREENRQGGGLAIIVRNDLCVKEKVLSDFPQGYLEVNAVTIHGVGLAVDIMNVYNPSCNVSQMEFESYFDQLCSPSVVLGDFNAHHIMWTSSGAHNVTGNNLVSSLLTFPDLSLVTPRDLPTYYHVPSRKFSTLDLCFISPVFLPSAQVDLQTDLGSDHTPILLSISFKPVCTSSKSRKRWIFGSEKCWNDWRCNLPDPDNVTDLSSSYSAFSANLLQASTTVFKQTSGYVTPHFSKVWWNSECSTLVAERHRCKNRFRRHPTIQNLIALRKAECLAKRAVKAAKVSSFRDFCGTLNRTTPPSVVWQRIGKLSNKSGNRVTGPLIKNGVLFVDPVAKTDLLASHFEELLNRNVHTVDSQTLLLPVTGAMLDDAPREYNRVFIMSELTFAISSLRNSAAGHDGIHNYMLKNLPDQYLDWALAIINLSFTETCIPGEWKLTVLNPIVKPGKPSDNTENFRPLSLLPCFAKLMEKLINRRLNFVLESTNSFSPSQCGFRKRLCTLDQISLFERVIKRTLATKAYCVSVFFDLSSAYDTVFHLGLLYKLSQRGVSGRLLRWIAEFLKDRRFHVFYEGRYSTVRSVSVGVPQGAILSPTLFNVMVAYIPHVPHVTMSEYADDILIYSMGWN